MAKLSIGKGISVERRKPDVIHQENRLIAKSFWRSFRLHLLSQAQRFRSAEWFGAGSRLYSMGSLFRITTGLLPAFQYSAPRLHQLIGTSSYTKENKQ
jgi:hypothetical protein